MLAKGCIRVGIELNSEQVWKTFSTFEGRVLKGVQSRLSLDEL